MASELSGGAAAILTIACLTLPQFVWWATAKSLRKRGWHWLVAHAVGSLVWLISFFPAILAAAFYDAVSPIVGIIYVAVVGYWMRRTYRAIRGMDIKQPSSPLSTIRAAEKPAVAPPEPYTPAQDTAEIEAIRQRSLAVMKKATDARKRDMKMCGEQKPAPMFTGTTAAAVIADIEFDYRDANDNASHRRVDVHSIDDEYFEGFCHKANDTRTFVIGRVKGKVLDRATGELLPPKRWAASVRDDPHNDGVVMNRGWKSPDDQEVEAREKPIEILFTGYSREQRAELEAQAEMHGMTVRKSVTNRLNYLCAGSNAGSAKLDQAAESGVEIIDEIEFVQLLAR